MKNDKEFVGTLRGFDDYVNIVLDDVTEIENTTVTAITGSSIPSSSNATTDSSSSSSASTITRKINKLDSILLNGNNITMLVPGSSPEEAALVGIGPKKQ